MFRARAYPHPKRSFPTSWFRAPPAVLCGLAAFALAGGAKAWPGDIEPPPAIYASGPTQWGETREQLFSDARELQAFCNFYLGRPLSGVYEACYIPAMDLVVLPTVDEAGGDARWGRLRAHEWAHARGWRHDLAKTAQVKRRR